MFEIYPLKYNIISNISYQILIFRENCSTGTFALAMQRDKKGRILSPSVVSRGQCTIKGFGESVVTPLQEGCRGRIPLPPREAMPRKRRRAQRGECRLVDGPSEVGTAGRNKDRRGGEKKRRGKQEKRERKNRGKNGKSVILPVGLHRTVSYYSLGEKCILRPFPGLTHL